MKEYGWTIEEYLHQPIREVTESVIVLNAIASKEKQEAQRRKRQSKKGKRGRRR